MNPLTYLQEVRSELTKVSWPSREHTLQSTLLVVVVSLVVALYLGGLDFIFQWIISQVLA